MSNKWLHHLSTTMSYLIYPFVCANHVKDIHHIQRAFETQNKMYRRPRELSIQTLEEVLNFHPYYKTQKICSYHNSSLANYV